MSLEGTSAAAADLALDVIVGAHGKCPICRTQVACIRSGTELVVVKHFEPGSAVACRGADMRPLEPRNNSY